MKKIKSPEEKHQQAVRLVQELSRLIVSKETAKVELIQTPYRKRVKRDKVKQIHSQQKTWEQRKKRLMKFICQP